MITKKLFYKIPIFWVFVLISSFTCNYSNAGLFFARQWNRIENPLMPIVRGLDTIRENFNTRLDQLSTNTTGHLDQIGERLIQRVDNIGNNLSTNVNQQLNATLHQVIDRTDHMRQEAIDQIHQVSNNLADNIHQQLNTTLNQVIDRTDHIRQEAIDQIHQVGNDIAVNIAQNVDTTVNQAMNNAHIIAQDLVNTVDTRVQNGIHEIDDRFNRTLKKGMFLAGGVAASSIAAWYGTKFLYTMLDRYYRQPRVFQETSTKSMLQKLKELVYKPKVEQQVLVFDAKKEAELASLARSVKAINAKIIAGNPTVRHRSVLLWGSPGTGKTAFAKKLAHGSGMDFRTMSGADIAKLNVNDALVALDEVFEYAKKNKNGLILMIDEAESFLSEREGAKTDTASYLVLSKFLSLSSSRSNKLMLITTTNHKEVLDKAFVDRLDQSIELKLPKRKERLTILRLYRDKYLLDSKYNSAEFISSAAEHVSDYKLELLASQLDKFSGRGLESVINNIKAEADGTESGLITAQLVNKVVKDALKKFIEFNQKPQNATRPQNQQNQQTLLSPAAIELLKI